MTVNPLFDTSRWTTVPQSPEQRRATFDQMAIDLATELDNPVPPVIPPPLRQFPSVPIPPWQARLLGVLVEQIRQRTDLPDDPFDPSDWLTPCPR